jgi:serine/threonine-protein kinase
VAARPATAAEFLALLRKSGLVAPLDLEAYLIQADALPTEAARLATRLTDHGLLTDFQARQLLLGKWRGFFLGNYKVLRPIASGGMGRVLLCQHTGMDRLVALKVLSARHGLDPVALRRFQREARASGSLDHPNIVRAYDMGQQDALFYLALEYVEGASLGELVRRQGPLPVAQAAECARQAALGLQHAHQAGWVHRDVKPDNLLLSASGLVKILDLGLVRSLAEPADLLTRAHEAKHILGTLDYLSPEQVRQSSAVDGRSDIYSLGATLYYLLTARPPFATGLVAHKLLSHLIEEAEPVRSLRADVPDGLAAVLHRMLEKDPARRHQDAGDVAEALAPWATPGSAVGERLLRGEPAAPPASLPSLAPPCPLARRRPVPRLLRRRARRFALWACLTLVVVAACTLAFGTGSALWRSASVNGDDEGMLPVLSAREANRRVGQTVRVTMEVRSTGVERRGSLIFLNSEEDFRDRHNFTIVVPRHVLDDPSDAGVQEFRRRWQRKRVRVEGYLQEFKGQAQIMVAGLNQVRILGEP